MNFSKLKENFSKCQELMKDSTSERQLFVALCVTLATDEFSENVARQVQKDLQRGIIWCRDFCNWDNKFTKYKLFRVQVMFVNAAIYVRERLGKKTILGLKIPKTDSNIIGLCVAFVMCLTFKLFCKFYKELKV